MNQCESKYFNSRKGYHLNSADTKARKSTAIVNKHSKCAPFI